MISAFYPFTRSQITKNKLISWWLNPMRSASCLKRCSFPAPPLPPGPISLPHRSVAVPENWGWRHGESHGSYGKICCKLSKPCVFFIRNMLKTIWKYGFAQEIWNNMGRYPFSMCPFQVWKWWIYTPQKWYVRASSMKISFLLPHEIEFWIITHFQRHPKISLMFYPISSTLYGITYINICTYIHIYIYT